MAATIAVISANAASSLDPHNVRQSMANLRLHEAAYEGNYDGVVRALFSGAHINHVDDFKHNALHKAVVSDKTKDLLKIVTMLISRGINLDLGDIYGDTALHMLMYKDVFNKIDILQALLDAGIDVNARNNDSVTALARACERLPDDMLGKVATLLLKKRSGIITCDGLALVQEDVDLTICDNKGHCPLHKAAARGDHELVKMFVDHGVDIDVKIPTGVSALFLAVAGDHIKTVQTLVKAGADIHTTNQDGVTPLHWAAAHGKIEMLKTLISLGANSDKTSELMQSSLLAAVHKGQNEAADELLKAGASRTMLYWWQKYGDHAQIAIVSSGLLTCLGCLLVLGIRHYQHVIQIVRMASLRVPFTDALNRAAPAA
jgi:ankyrin repeat protein